MENTDITTIINNETKVKKPASEAQMRASKKFYEKHKNTEEYKQKNREHAKEQYQKNRENVIARVRLNQKRKQGIEQLERLYELKQQGLITFQELNANGYQELLANLEILGFSTLIFFIYICRKNIYKGI